MKIGGRNINGVDTEIHASPDGLFQVQVDGKTIGSGETLDTAVNQARTSINRDKTVVNVEFITKTGGEHGVATGFHSRNRTIMAKIAGGKGEQLDYGTKAFRHDIPKKDLDRYFALKGEIDALKTEQRDLELKYEIVLRDSVQHAITDAQNKTLSGIVAKQAARRTTSQRRRRY